MTSVTNNARTLTRAKVFFAQVLILLLLVVEKQAREGIFKS